MNSSKAYRVFTSVGVRTPFRLPEGWKITYFVVTYPRSFHAELNGTISIVTPLATNKATWAIFTENDRLFVFSLSSEPSERLDPLVIVQASNLQFFSSKIKAEAQKLAKERLEAAQTQCDASTDQKLRQLKQPLHFSPNSN